VESLSLDWKKKGEKMEIRGFLRSGGKKCEKNETAVVVTTLTK